MYRCLSLSTASPTRGTWVRFCARQERSVGTGLLFHSVAQWASTRPHGRPQPVLRRGFRWRWRGEFGATPPPPPHPAGRGAGGGCGGVGVGGGEGGVGAGGRGVRCDREYSNLGGDRVAQRGYRCLGRTVRDYEAARDAPRKLAVRPVAFPRVSEEPPICRHPE